VLSGTQFGENLDLKPIGTIASPWPIAKCPSNGFVIFKDDFTKEELRRLEVFVQTPEYQKLQKVESNYFLAAMLMKQIDTAELSIAFALLKSTWEADNDEQYRRYAGVALESFKALLSHPAKSIESKDLLTCLHLSGELERRLGNFENAKTIFLSVLANPRAKGTDMESLANQELLLIQANDSLSRQIALPKKN
jgi:uncharacterized protein (DUF2225 family)